MGDTPIAPIVILKKHKKQAFRVLCRVVAKVFLKMPDGLYAGGGGSLIAEGVLNTH